MFPRSRQGWRSASLFWEGVERADWASSNQDMRESELIQKQGNGRQDWMKQKQSSWGHASTHRWIRTDTPIPPPLLPISHLPVVHSIIFVFQTCFLGSFIPACSTLSHESSRFLFVHFSSLESKRWWVANTCLSTECMKQPRVDAFPQLDALIYTRYSVSF